MLVPHTLSAKCAILSFGVGIIIWPFAHLPVRNSPFSTHAYSLLVNASNSYISNGDKNWCPATLDTSENQSLIDADSQFHLCSSSARNNLPRNYHFPHLSLSTLLGYISVFIISPMPVDLHSMRNVEISKRSPLISFPTQQMRAPMMSSCSYFLYRLSSDFRFCLDLWRGLYSSRTRRCEWLFAAHLFNIIKTKYDLFSCDFGRKFRYPATIIF